MINLYKPVDDTFLQLWNKIHTHVNPTWVAQIRTQLAEACPAYLDCTESQAADLRVTQQWLRMMLWQLCLSQGLVSSVAAETAMTFTYPIDISRELFSMTHQFSQHAMEAHGVGLVSFLLLRQRQTSRTPSFEFPTDDPSRTLIPVALLSLVAPIRPLYSFSIYAEGQNVSPKNPHSLSSTWHVWFR